MVSLLAKLFNKDPSDTAKQRQAIGSACGVIGIGLNLLLFAMKLVAASATSAVSIRADAFNNLSDAGTSLVTLVGFLLARQRPDPEHPFGHGRMEYISGLAVAMAVVLMGFNLLETSIEKISSAQEVVFSLSSVLILLAAIGVKLVMVGDRAPCRRVRQPERHVCQRRGAARHALPAFLGLAYRRLRRSARLAVHPFYGAENDAGDDCAAARAGPVAGADR